MFRTIKVKLPRVYEKAQLLKMHLQHYKTVLFCGKNRDLMKFKDKHKGQRCFIVATGPSLTIEDLELIKDEVCFGVNSCIKSFDKTQWRPRYLCVSDWRVWERIGAEICEVSKEIETLFLGKSAGVCSLGNCVQFVQDERPSTYLETEYRKRTKKEKKSCRLYLSQKPDYYFCDGPTVIFSVIQLAVYMGFSEIYLLGTDCNYQGKDLYSSFASYQNAPIPDNAEEKLIFSYIKVKQELEERKIGVKIFNVTRGGMLEVFERKHLESVLNSDKKDLSC